MTAALTPWLVVFLGGGIGSALRHGVNLAAARTGGTGFPFGTLEHDPKKWKPVFRKDHAQTKR